MHTSVRGFLLLLVLAGVVSTPRDIRSEDKPAAPAEPATAKGPVRLAKDQDVWIDMEHKTVITGGEICLRAGRLEMFACPKKTKEHESIVAVVGQGRLLHAGLLAVGALPGHPVKFDPEYRAATGTEIEIRVQWEDEKGKHDLDAREMVRDRKTGKAMTYTWVFAGSVFREDPDTKEKFYIADYGDLICISNFPGAMLDLPIQSTSSNDDLEFDAITEKIPPLGTKVRLLLTPKLKDTKEEKKKSDEAKPVEDKKLPTENKSKDK